MLPRRPAAAARQLGEFADNLNGDGRTDDQLGNVTGTLAGNMDLTTAIDDMLGSGVLAPVVEITSDDPALRNDPTVGVRFVGKDGESGDQMGAALVEGVLLTNPTRLVHAPAAATLHLPLYEHHRSRRPCRGRPRARAHGRRQRFRRHAARRPAVAGLPDAGVDGPHRHGGVQPARLPAARWPPRRRRRRRGQLRRVRALGPDPKRRRARHPAQRRQRRLGAVARQPAQGRALIRPRHPRGAVRRRNLPRAAGQHARTASSTATRPTSTAAAPAHRAAPARAATATATARPAATPASARRPPAPTASATASRPASTAAAAAASARRATSAAAISTARAATAPASSCRSAPARTCYATTARATMTRATSTAAATARTARAASGATATPTARRRPASTASAANRRRAAARGLGLRRVRFALQPPLDGALAGPGLPALLRHVVELASRSTSRSNAARRLASRLRRSVALTMSPLGP